MPSIMIPDSHQKAIVRTIIDLTYRHPQNAVAARVKRLAAELESLVANSPDNSGALKKTAEDLLTALPPSARDTKAAINAFIAQLGAENTAAAIDGLATHPTHLGALQLVQARELAPAALGAAGQKNVALSRVAGNGSPIALQLEGLEKRNFVVRLWRALKALFERLEPQTSFGQRFTDEALKQLRQKACEQAMEPQSSNELTDLFVESQQGELQQALVAQLGQQKNPELLANTIILGWLDGLCSAKADQPSVIAQRLTKMQLEADIQKNPDVLKEGPALAVEDAGNIGPAQIQTWIAGRPSLNVLKDETKRLDNLRGEIAGAVLQPADKEALYNLVDDKSAQVAGHRQVMEALQATKSALKAFDANVLQPPNSQASTADKLATHRTNLATAQATADNLARAMTTVQDIPEQVRIRGILLQELGRRREDIHATIATIARTVADLEKSPQGPLNKIKVHLGHTSAKPRQPLSAAQDLNDDVLSLLKAAGTNVTEVSLNEANGHLTVAYNETGKDQTKRFVLFPEPETSKGRFFSSRTKISYGQDIPKQIAKIIEGDHQLAYGTLVKQFLGVPVAAAQPPPPQPSSPSVSVHVATPAEPAAASKGGDSHSDGVVAAPSARAQQVGAGKLPKATLNGQEIGLEVAPVNLFDDKPEYKVTYQLTDGTTAAFVVGANGPTTEKESAKRLATYLQVKPKDLYPLMVATDDLRLREKQDLENGAGGHSHSVMQNAREEREGRATRQKASDQGSGN